MTTPIGLYSTSVRLLHRYRTRKRLTVIKDAVAKAAADPAAEDLEASVLEQVGNVRGVRRKQVSDLVHQEVRSYLIHESEPLKEVEDYIRLFPPELPRGAKRMLNHARVLTRVALDRHVLDGGEVTPQHLGKWIVVSERWVDVALLREAQAGHAPPARGRRAGGEAGRELPGARHPRPRRRAAPGSPAQRRRRATDPLRAGYAARLMAVGLLHPGEMGAAVGAQLRAA